MSRSLLAAIIALAFGLTSRAPSASAELPATLPASDVRLVLNGSGARSKYMMKMYVGGLYLEKPSADAAAIVAADAPMAIRLEITSGMVTQKKMVDSLNEGFEKSTKGKTEPLSKEIDDFRKCFAKEIVKGDIFDIVYLPTHRVVVSKNGKEQGSVPGLSFKQTLFGIWLSADPADATLKRGMLAARRQ